MCYNESNLCVQVILFLFAFEKVAYGGAVSEFYG